jgi:hypothetical protein
MSPAFSAPPDLTCVSPESLHLPGLVAGVHNGYMTDGQSGAVCPQCGSADAVHSIEELVALTQGRLNTQQQETERHGWRGQPQQGPAPGWAQEPTSGPPGGWQSNWQGGSRSPDYDPNSSIGDDIAGLAMGAAGRLIGRAIGRRVERAMTEKIMPALQARGQQTLATQTAIAQRYPGLRACMTDKVIFLAGGSRTAPMASVNLSTVTMDQADALVASLRDG